MRRFALTAIGRDRPGIVASVTKVLFEHDCNIEDSTMTAIEDEFAIILIMSMPDRGDAASLEAGLRALEGSGLTIGLSELGERHREGPPGNFLITLHGADRAGIVYRLTAALASFGVNITDLETKVVGAPMKVYIMLLEVYCPDDADMEGLKRSLASLEGELGVTIRIKPVEETEVL